MPKLRIAPRWLGEPLWVEEPSKRIEAVDIDDLDLSDALADRIEAWVDVFDAIYDADHPSQSHFPDPATERSWRAEGERIVAAIAGELGEGWQIELDLSGIDERPLA